MGRYTTGPPGRHENGRGSSSGRGRIGGGRGRGRGGGGRTGGRTNGSHYKTKPIQSKGNNNNSRPDTTGTTVSNSVQELQNQMQRINNTIGNTLSLNAISTNKDCPKCIETTYH